MESLKTNISIFIVNIYGLTALKEIVGVDTKEDPRKCFYVRVVLKYRDTNGSKG